MNYEGKRCVCVPFEGKVLWVNGAICPRQNLHSMKAISFSMHFFSVLISGAVKGCDHRDM